MVRVKPKRRSVRSRPTLEDLPGLQQARGLWAAGRYAQALDAFDRVARARPDNLLALSDAARAFGGRCEIRSAERLLDRLQAGSGLRVERLVLAGQTYRMLGRPRQAMDCLREVLQLAPSRWDAALELALLQERLGELDQATSQAQHVVTLDPQCQEARFLLARIDRRRGAWDAAKMGLEAVTAATHADAAVRSRAHYELALVHEALGDFHAAFQSAVSAKACVQPQAEALRARAERSRAFLQHLTARDDLAKMLVWSDDDRADLGPNRQLSLLTGMPRSGTTLIEKVLASHPQVTTIDEYQAFPKYINPSLLAQPDGASEGWPTLDAIDTDRARTQRQRYWDYLEQIHGASLSDQWVVDKNPSTLELVPIMARIVPECRFLVVLRDPRDVITSCFFSYLPLNTYTVDFQTIQGTAWRADHDLRQWLRWREELPIHWAEVRYENVVHDLAQGLRPAVELLGLGADTTLIGYRSELQGSFVNSPTYDRVAQPIDTAAIGRWKNYEPYLSEAFDAVAELCERLEYPV